MEPTLFTPGQRVGIVTGVQSINGPRVTRYGTIVQAVETWHGLTEYLVEHPDGSRLIYRPFLLREVPAHPGHEMILSDAREWLGSWAEEMPDREAIIMACVGCDVERPTTDAEFAAWLDDAFATDNDDAVSERAATVESNDNL